MRIMRTKVVTAQTENHDTAYAIAKTLLPEALDVKVIKVIETPKTNPTTTWHAWCDELAIRLVLAPAEWVETLTIRFHNSEEHWHEATWMVKFASHERAKRERMLAAWETYWVEHNVAFSIDALK